MKRHVFVMKALDRSHYKSSGLVSINIFLHLFFKAARRTPTPTQVCQKIHRYFAPTVFSFHPAHATME